MDLKKYAGKQICMQLKGGQAWLVTVAKEAGAEVLMLAATENEPRQPCAFPFVQGLVNEDGHLVMETGKGGEVTVEFDPDVVHSVSIATKKPSMLVQPGN